jgi:hypothetical protein
VKLGTGIWLIGGYVWILIGVSVFAYNAYKAVRNMAGPRMHNLSMMLLALYPLGVGCKISLTGPEFVRYHLSDIGFPVFLGYVFYGHFRAGYEKRNNAQLDALPVHEDMAIALRHRRGTLIVALVASYLYEIGTGLLYRTHPAVKVQLVGSFDWWDVAYYTLGAACGYLLLRRWQYWVDYVRTAYQAQQEAAEAEKRAERRRRRQTRQPRSVTRRGRRRKHGR